MTYNKGFDFWNEEHAECNCGSYAFNLDEWYHPGCICGRYNDCDEDVITFLDCWNAEGVSDDELADELASFYLDKIKNDFGNSIVISVIEPDVELFETEEVEVIAFRAGAYEFDGEIDYDFHFKVYRFGQWFEKRGHEPIRPTNLDDWCASLYYNSQTFYIVHHLENLTSIKKDDILFIE